MLLSCSVVKYSFTGVSIPPDAKTFSVPNFTSSASYIQADLVDKLTDDLRMKLMRETSLEMIDDNGDLHFQGQVTGYVESYQGVSSDEKPEQNKLTITVRVTFVNKKDEKQNYERTFSDFELYDTDLDFSEIEEDLINTISERLIDQIFQAGVANW